MVVCVYIYIYIYIWNAQKHVLALGGNLHPECTEAYSCTKGNLADCDCGCWRVVGHKRQFGRDARGEFGALGCWCGEYAWEGGCGLTGGGVLQALERIGGGDRDRG